MDKNKVVYCGSCGVAFKPHTYQEPIRCNDCLYVPPTRIDDNKKFELLKDNLCFIQDTRDITEFKHNGVELRDDAIGGCA